jgi:hypothetical protein
MDVGGTLAKIVFLEKDIVPDSPPPSDAASNSSKESNSGSPREDGRRGIVNDRWCHDAYHTASAEALIILTIHIKKPSERLYALMESSERNGSGNGGMYRDETLSFYSELLGGRLHFFLF